MNNEQAKRAIPTLQQRNRMLPMPSENAEILIMLLDNIVSRLEALEKIMGQTTINEVV